MSQMNEMLDGLGHDRQQQEVDELFALAL